MKTMRVDEYLIINTNTGAKRWVAKQPKRKPNEVVLRIRGIVNYPEPIFLVNFGDLTCPEAEVNAQAEMQ